MSDRRQQRFLSLIQTDHFARTEELVQRLDDGGFWTEEDLAGAVDMFKRVYVRRMVRSIKDESGWPIIASIEWTDQTGETMRGYMPETLFDMEQYRQVVVYNTERAHYFIHMANGYTDRANNRYGEQLPLPFPETD